VDSSTAGIVALAGCAVALGALIVAVVAIVRLRRLRADQRVLLGAGSSDDLVEHAARIEQEFRSLHAYVGDIATRLDGRLGAVEDRLDHTIAFRGLVRFDAYNEMSGQQSVAIALLDAEQSGLVLSSIHHRDQARLYVKHVVHGEPEYPLSPEEIEAVRVALAGEPPPEPPRLP
jgi:HAMP domain-containing protein